MIPYAAIAAVLSIAAVLVGIWLADNFRLETKQTSGVVRGKVHILGTITRRLNGRLLSSNTPQFPEWRVLIDTPFGTQWIRVSRGYFEQLQVGFVGIVWYTRTRISKRISIQNFQVD